MLVKTLSRLVAPLLVLAIALVLIGQERPIAAALTTLIKPITPKDAEPWTLALVFAALAFLATRVIDLLLWRGVLPRRSGIQTPALLKSLVAGVIWLIAITLIASIPFGQSITGLITASSVVLAVVGFALRGMIADFFYGITIAVERPFDIGHWIQVEPGLVGQVMEMNWRATRLLTNDHVSVTVANSQIAQMNLRNYSIPQPWFRWSMKIVLDFEVTPEEGERLLVSAARSVADSASVPREPDARILSFKEEGVEWELRYWMPDVGRFPHVQAAVHRAVYENLAMAGRRPARERKELFVGPLGREREREQTIRDSWLDRVDLFATLAPEDRRTLAALSRRRDVPQNAVLVHEGEEGNSLFILREGLLQVSVGGQTVGRIRPGEVMGEMSLLTGAPRGATVIADTPCLLQEVTATDLAPLLDHSPGLIEQMGAILEARQNRNAQALSAGEDGGTSQRGSTGALMVDRIRRFFRHAGPH
ncbi:MAG: mechanosensitive ion channel family protein [Rhodospirillum sp.]|nr:mechanosensitive ion channel family protein [Rhodospirillum sp.]MCF8500479.1 mechanosensitive ion channel family protein [Rhodospirillum sp.]